jgi:hypothetical protein
MKPSMSEEATRYFSCATTANISKNFIPLSRLKGLSIYDHFRERSTKRMEKPIVNTFQAKMLRTIEW